MSTVHSLSPLSPNRALCRRPHCSVSFLPCRFRSSRAQVKTHSASNSAQALDLHNTSQKTWQQLETAKSRLEGAVKEENYSLAAKLRDEIKGLQEALPPLKLYVFHQLEALKNGTPEEKARAISTIGEIGDEATIPDLAVFLHNEQLQEVATAALWSIFMRSKNPAVNELMAKGTQLMTNQPHDYDEMLRVFDEVVQLEPTFAEGYNKKATVLYLQKKYKESIKECEIVLSLNPYHFGAASGMGLCFFQLDRHDEALRAFEQAISIHPGMRNIAKILSDLKKTKEA